MNPINSLTLPTRHSLAGGNPVVLFNMPLGFVLALQGVGFFGFPPARE